MKFSTFTSIITTLCFVALLTMASCTGKDDTNTKTVTTDSTQVGTPVDPPTSATALDQNLYVLWIEVKTIINNTNIKANKRLLFKFYVNNSNAFTLHGWSPRDGGDNGGKFGPTPDVELKTGRLSDGLLKIEQKTYLGNLAIHRDIVHDIKTSIGEKYLVFIPRKDTDINGNSSIKYELFLTNENPTLAGSKFQEHSTIGDANPTPPRNYDGSFE